MAKKNLINNIKGPSRQYYAGAEFDTVQDAALITSLAAGGAVFAPNEIPAVAAAALIAQQMLKSGQLATDDSAASNVMMGALLSLSAKQSFDLTLVAGTRAKSDTLTIGPNTTAQATLKTAGGTAGPRLLIALVQGGPGVGSVTVTSVDAAGALVNTDTSTYTITLSG